VDFHGWKSTLAMGYLLRGRVPNACVGGFGDKYEIEGPRF
jgi:hypothetical protein